MGRPCQAMPSNMAAPHKTLLTKETELYPFLESKKWYLLLRGFCGENHQLVNMTRDCIE